ncbi:hypothetical protein [Pseudoduganella sp. R-43]|uniref:hypothetical protein n=1 Tax=Pseudoduganella sp. R-43 TaxID=3404063 RepID=UPI003CED352B
MAIRLSYPKILLTLSILASGTQAFAESPPTEFVPQILEPTGGTITRPKSWFFSEGHRGPMYMWTISREDIAGKRPYTTGVRIQSFVGVKEHFELIDMKRVEK